MILISSNPTTQPTTSRCATPATTPTPERVFEHDNVAISRHDLLVLDPHQQLEAGRVHLLPQVEIPMKMNQKIAEGRRQEKSISTKVKKAFNWGKK